MTPPEKVNILLVDDQPAKLLSYEVILQDLGQELLKAHSAREALEILLKNDVAVVLTDVCMPELDGFELAKMLREHPRYETTAIIFISAVHLNEEDLARGYQLGAVDYVSVPVVPDILRAKVKVFVDLYRKTQELGRMNKLLEQRVRERTYELEDANTRLRESEERLRLASEAAEFGTYDYNIVSDSMHCSPHLKRLLGTDIDGEMSLAAFLGLVNAKDQSAVQAVMRNNESRAAESHENEFRTGGRWLMNRGRSFEVGAEGERQRLHTMGTILDITTRKALEERQTLLLAELDHRVKNILANVSAMARLSGRKATSVDAFVETLDGRLQSMAQAHALLSKSSWSSAELGELATAVLSPFTSRTGDNIVLKGDPLYLRPKVAQGMALVLNELATNAVKHGSLSSKEGRVHLSWSQSNGAAKITWKESGGPAVAAPTRKGLGLNIMQTAFSEPDVELDCAFADQGVVCTIKGKLSGEHPGNKRTSVMTADLLPKVPQAREAGPVRILVVEDEPLICMQLQADLEDHGHTVVGPAANLAEGLKLAQAQNFDVALLDVNLGHETSAEIAKVLASRRIPFAFSTGYTDGSTLPEEMLDRPRLAKPYTLEAVQRMIEQLSSANADQDPPRYSMASNG